MSDKKQPCSIFETTAELIERTAPKKGNGATMVRNISDLLRSLDSGDEQKIEVAFEKLGGPHQHDLFQQVGQMTRNLHQALNEFNKSLTRDPHHMQSTNIGDATVKLENVVKATADAAHKTLALTEAQAHELQVAQDLGKQIEQALARGAPPAEITTLFRTQQEVLQKSVSINNDILMSQSFQDLTGQAVKKVITLVTELEQNLVSLIKIFGIHEKPEAATEDTAPKLAQDDVDSILSNFGF